MACEGTIAVASVPTSEGVSIRKGVTGILRWGLKKLKIKVKGGGGGASACVAGMIET